MKNIYGLYKHARNATWQLLIDCDIRSLPINIIDVCNNSDIDVIKNSSVGELRMGEIAVSILDGDKWYIVYDDTMSKQRSRFSIAHELGHIYLGHPLIAGYHARTIDKSKPETEVQADIFASRFLAPACVLWGLNIHTAEDIMHICNISRQAAEIRAERMKLLYERQKFLTSPLERTVYNNFLDYINKNMRSSES